MTLPRHWQKHALALVEQASPLEGEFFRSVEFAYAHPDDVVSGEGTRSYGGRFVRPGRRAVYGSVDEETAFRESAARVNRLAGRGGARVASFPRITYVIAVKIAAHVALIETHADAAAILPACLDPNDPDRFAGSWRVSPNARHTCRRFSLRDSGLQRPESRRVPRCHPHTIRRSRQSRTDY